AGPTPAGSPSPGEGALARQPVGRLFGGARNRLPGSGLAHRAVRRAVLAGPHAAAFAAHDCRPAAPLAGSAAVPDPPRPSAAGTQVLGRPPVAFPGTPSLLRAADPPGGSAAPLHGHHLAVARAGGLRTRPALRRLALPPARLFPGRGAAVLVSRRPAVPQPPALVVLAAVALPVPGGPA